MSRIAAVTHLIGPAMVVSIAAIVGIGADMLLARLLGATEYGRYSLAYSIAATVVLIASLGLPAILPRVVAEAHAQGTFDAESRYRPYLAGSFLAGAASTILVGGTVLAFYAVLADTVTGPLFITTTALSFSLFVWLWCRGIATGRRLVLSAVVPKEILAPGLLIAAVSLYDIRSAVAVCIGASLVILLVHIPMLVRWLLPALRTTRLTARFDATKKWIGPALALGTTSLATIGFFRWDILILGIFVDIEEVAGYVAASRIALAGLVVQRVIELGITKYVVETLINSVASEKIRIIVVYSSIAGVCATCGIAILILIGDIALSAFGSFALGFRLHLVILLVGQFFLAVTTVVDIVAVTGGAHRARAIWVVGTSVLNVGCNLYAAANFGSLGCAIATASTLAIARIGVAVIAWQSVLSPTKQLE